jgi:DNA-binding Xre family transcriptional regulator
MNSQELRWRVRELAVECRVTVGELLREAGISWATLHRWQTGKAKPLLSSIVRINEAADRLRGRK